MWLKITKNYSPNFDLKKTKKKNKIYNHPLHWNEK